MITEEKFDSSS